MPSYRATFDVLTMHDQDESNGKGWSGKVPELTTICNAILFFLSYMMLWINGVDASKETVRVALFM